MSDGATRVSAILKKLGAHEIHCLLFGGWAEEALGLISPRRHKDIDLLLPAATFDELDRVLRAPGAAFNEIALKRFAHKRAFLFDGIMVEIILVRRSAQTAWTLFWGDVRFEWALPLEESCRLGGSHLLAVSRENLKRYRDHHLLTQPWRWKDPASLVA